MEGPDSDLTFEVWESSPTCNDLRVGVGFLFIVAISIRFVWPVRQTILDSMQKED